MATLKTFTVDAIEVRTVGDLQIAVLLASNANESAEFTLGAASYTSKPA